MFRHKKADQQIDLLKIRIDELERRNKGLEEIAKEKSNEEQAVKMSNEITEFCITEFCIENNIKLDEVKSLVKKPCPFCGSRDMEILVDRSLIGQPIYAEIAQGGIITNPDYIAECPKCKARGPNSGCGVGSYKKALEDWNKRSE